MPSKYRGLGASIDSNNSRDEVALVRRPPPDCENVSPATGKVVGSKSEGNDHDSDIQTSIVSFEGVTLTAPPTDSGFAHGYTASTVLAEEVREAHEMISRTTPLALTPSDMRELMRDKSHVYGGLISDLDDFTRHNQAYLQLRQEDLATKKPWRTVTKDDSPAKAFPHSLEGQRLLVKRIFEAIVQTDVIMDEKHKQRRNWRLVAREKALSSKNQRHEPDGNITSLSSYFEPQQQTSAPTSPSSTQIPVPSGDGDINLASNAESAISDESEPSLVDPPAVQRVHKLSNLEVELLSWSILFSVKNAQDGAPTVFPWSTDFKLEPFPSFMDRLNATIDACNANKHAIKQMLTANFIDRLAAGPAAEIRRKKANHTGNKRKAAHMTVGLAKMNEQTWTYNKFDDTVRTQSGEIVPMEKVRREQPELLQVTDQIGRAGEIECQPKEVTSESQEVDAEVPAPAKRTRKSACARGRGGNPGGRGGRGRGAGNRGRVGGRPGTRSATAAVLGVTELQAPHGNVLSSLDDSSVLSPASLFDSDTLTASSRSDVGSFQNVTAVSPTFNLHHDSASLNGLPRLYEQCTGESRARFNPSLSEPSKWFAPPVPLNYAVTKETTVPEPSPFQGQRYAEVSNAGLGFDAGRGLGIHFGRPSSQPGFQFEFRPTQAWGMHLEMEHPSPIPSSQPHDLPTSIVGEGPANTTTNSVANEFSFQVTPRIGAMSQTRATNNTTFVNHGTVADGENMAAHHNPATSATPLFPARGFRVDASPLSVLTPPAMFSQNTLDSTDCAVRGTALTPGLEDTGFSYENEWLNDYPVDWNGTNFNKDHATMRDA